MSCVIRRRSLAGVIVVLVLGIAGCGDPPRGDLRGSIRYHGRAVPYGTVLVIASDQQPYYGTIGLDGSYSVKQLPLGPAQVAVNSPDPSFERKLPPEVQAEIDALRAEAGIVLPPKPPKGVWFPIPQQYSEPRKSGLTVTVTEPEVVYDITLQ